jgi:hypothetical protein
VWNGWKLKKLFNFEFSMEKCDASTFTSSIRWSILQRTAILSAEIVDTYNPSNLCELLHIYVENRLHNKFPKSTQVRNWPTLPIFDSTTSGKLLFRFWYILYYCVFCKVCFWKSVSCQFWSLIEKVEKVEEKWPNLRQKSSLLVNFTILDLDEFLTWVELTYILLFPI